jgi:hypothetical protein
VRNLKADNDVQINYREAATNRAKLEFLQNRSRLNERVSKVSLRLADVNRQLLELNREIMETIYFGGLEASMELAREHGPYESYPGSPVSNGVLHPCICCENEIG